MKFPITTSKPFLTLSLLGFCSGLVGASAAAETKAESASGGYVMSRHFNYETKPNKVYRNSSGEVAFTISGNPTDHGFHIVDDKQQSVMDVHDADITCGDPFSYSIAAEQLTFTTHAPPKAPPSQPPNPRAWKITYRGSEFNYARKPLVDDASVTGQNGVLDTSITNSFNDKNPAWKVKTFGEAVITINIKPSAHSKLPVKYTLGLLMLQQQHGVKCESYKSK